MARASVIFGFAAALAMVSVAGAPAFAQAAASAPQTRFTPPQTRYATQLSPAADDALVDGAPLAAAPPVAAPTTPVSVVPENTPPTNNYPQAQAQPIPQSSFQPPPQPAPRYATMEQQPETVRVVGLRPSEDSAAYRLGVGDRVRVTVFKEEDLSGEFQLDSQGFVRLPLIGPVRALGLSTYGLEARITESLINGGYLNEPHVNVEVTAYRPFYIIGEVTKPGEYPYVNAMSAPNAIALAGGYKEGAVESTIYVRHLGELREHEEPADDSTRIQPGDFVRVTRSTYWSIMTLLSPIISPLSTVAYLLK